MNQSKQRLLLFVLCITLLLVVSARVSPAPPAAEAEPAPDEREIVVPEEAEETPEPSPETTPDIRDILPDISASDWYLKLVNNTYVLPPSFTPPAVREIQDGQYFDSRATDALNRMLDAARAEGYTVYIGTGYRPYRTQATLFYGKASQIAWGGAVEYAEAEELARQTVAYPGTSEHQLGLAVDILDAPDTRMDADALEDLPLYVWLRAHCVDYGFIPRYPRAKQDLTGWFEPWHYRYVGETAARYILENGLCLEEFIALY